MTVAGAVLAAGALAGAVEANEVVVYGFPGGYIEAAARAFQEIHPDIRVSVITGEGPEILSRLMGESAQPRADVVDISAEIVLTNPHLFKPWTSAHEADFPEWAIMKIGEETYGYGYSISMQIFMVNTNEMPLEQAPRSWEDLMAPEMHGKFIFGNPALVQAGLFSFNQVQIMYGEEGARALVENARFGDSASSIPPIVGRGELPIGIVEEARIVAFKNDGYPVEAIYPEEGVVPTISLTALVNNGPNPENAQLFADFMTSAEGHAINLETRGRRSPRPDAGTPPGVVPMSELRINDSVSMEDMIANREETLAVFNQMYLAAQ